MYRWREIEPRIFGVYVGRECEAADTRKWFVESAACLLLHLPEPEANDEPPYVTQYWLIYNVSVYITCWNWLSSLWRAFLNSFDV